MLQKCGSNAVRHFLYIHASHTLDALPRNACKFHRAAAGNKRLAFEEEPPARLNEERAARLIDGDARATSQGDSAPSPSLKGSSALLELGYRFAPQGSRMSYDLNLNGWQGKRRGVTGGVSVKWAF